MGKCRGMWKSMIYSLVRLYRLDPLLRNDYLHACLSSAQERAVQGLLAAFASRSSESHFHSEMLIPDPISTLEERAPVTSRGPRERRSQRARHGHARSSEVNGEDCMLDPVASDGRSSGSESGMQHDTGTANESCTDEYSDRGSDTEGDRISSVEASDSEVTATVDPAGDGYSDDVAEAIAKFSVFLCTEEYTDGLPASTALVYLNVILGITSDGSAIKRRRNYTPKVSALIH